MNEKNSCSNIEQDETVIYVDSEQELNDDPALYTEIQDYMESYHEGFNNEKNCEWEEANDNSLLKQTMTE